MTVSHACVCAFALTTGIAGVFFRDGCLVMQSRVNPNRLSPGSASLVCVLGLVQTISPLNFTFIYLISTP